MAHADPEVIALIALGEKAGTDEERAHLAGCAHCQEGLRSLAATVSAARQADASSMLVAPPARLWTRIAADTDVAGGEDLAPAPDSAARAPGARRARRRRAGRARPVLVAAACLMAGVIIGLAGAGVFGGQAGQAPARPLGQSPLRPLPQFPQWQAARGTAVMRSGPAGLRLQVLVQAPRRPGFLEVWLLARNGVSMISLGDLNRHQDGEFSVPPGVDLRNYSRIDVSLQQFNGRTAHSRISVLRGRLPG